MELSRRKKHKRGFFDVHKTKRSTWPEKLVHYFKRPHVVNLRPKLREKHPWLAVGGALFLMIVLVLGVKKVFTHAEVADFYPSTCLGTWQNPQNAQGMPETFDSADSPQFSDVDSAVLFSREGEIFCGSFIPSEYEARGDIKNVGLTLVWHLEGIPSSTDPVVLPAPDADAPVFSPTLDEAPAIETQQQENFAPSEEIQQSGSSSTQQSDSSSTTFLLERTVHPFFGSWIFTPVFAQEEGNPAPKENEANIPPPDETPPPAVPDEITPPPAEESILTPAPEENPTTESSTQPLIIAPPVYADLKSTSTEIIGESDSTITITSSTAEIIIPAPMPDDNFMLVSYSTDGETWFELQQVNPHNWENLTIPVPVRIWDDLRQLQIRVEAIPTSLETIPRAYLDGMFVEIHYEVSAAIPAEEDNVKQDNIEQDNAQDKPSLVSEPEKEKIKVFDSGSKHVCAADPFTRTAKKGEAVGYQISLHPSFQNSYFEVLTGDLPSGVSAVFDHERGVGTSTPNLTLNVSDGAEAGSFGIVVVYRETDSKLETMANFCQLNLIIE